MTTLDRIATTLARLDTRRHVTRARLEVCQYGDGWLAQVMADPLRTAATGIGSTIELALDDLATALDRLDWRKVKR